VVWPRKIQRQRVVIVAGQPVELAREEARTHGHAVDKENRIALSLLLVVKDAAVERVFRHHASSGLIMR